MSIKPFSFWCVCLIASINCALAQEKSVGDFTATGDEINCITTKFLLDRNDSRKDSICSDCSYEQLKVRFAPWPIRNTAIRDAIEAKKVVFRQQAGFKNWEDTVTKTDQNTYVIFANSLIKYALEEVEKTSKKENIPELKAIFKKDFPGVYTPANGESTKTETKDTAQTGGVGAPSPIAKNPLQKEVDRLNNKNTELTEKIDELEEQLIGGGSWFNTTKWYWIVAIAFSVLLNLGLLFYVFGGRFLRRKGSGGNNKIVPSKDLKSGIESRSTSLSDESLKNHLGDLKSDYLNNKIYPSELVQSVFEENEERWGLEMAKKKYSIHEKAQKFKTDLGFLVGSDLQKQCSLNYYSEKEALSRVSNLFSLDNIKNFKEASSLEVVDVEGTADRYKDELIQLVKGTPYLLKDELESKFDDSIGRLKIDLERQSNSDVQKPSIVTDQEAIEVSKQTDDEGKKFYLPFPDKEGFFWNKDLLDEPDEIYSAYAIRIHPSNPTKATFSFLTESKKVNPAIQNFDVTLQPVCEILSFNESGVGKIRQVGEEGGALRLEGDKWRVVPDKKLRIEIL